MPRSYYEFHSVCYGNCIGTKPYEPYYWDPVYDVTDNFGDFDDDGKAIGDGVLDNPGDIIFHKKTRTGQKDSYSLGVDFLLLFLVLWIKNYKISVKRQLPPTSH